MKWIEFMLMMPEILGGNHDEILKMVDTH